MSFTHLHLLLNHLPVIGLLGVIVLLIVALKVRSDDISKLSLALLGVLSVIGLLTFLTGDPAAESIENLPGFSEAITERHEEFALIATILLGVCGAIATGVLIWARRKPLPRRAVAIVLVMSLLAGGTMGYTALLGGQVRHTEIRSDAVTTTED